MFRFLHQALERLTQLAWPGGGPWRWWELLVLPGLLLVILALWPMS